MDVSAFLRLALSVAAVTVTGSAAAQISHNATAESSRTRQEWAGSYIGLQVGVHFTGTHVETTQQTTVDTDLSRNGAFGGIQFGDGRQVGGFYLGTEADSAFGRFVSAHIAATSTGSPAGNFEAHRRFVGTVRAKVGRPFGRLLLYGTGGFALGGLEQGVTFNAPTSANTPLSRTSSGGVEPGYAVGGGVEYRATRRFSYQVESLYYRLQDKTLHLAGVSGSAGTVYSSTLRNDGSVLRVGANYRF